MDLANLSEEDHRKLLKIVNGALKSCIDTHGPIDKRMISSASKRVVGQLSAYFKGKAPELDPGHYSPCCKSKLVFSYPIMACPRCKQPFTWPLIIDGEK